MMTDKARILIVDDEYSIRTFMSEILKEYGYETETARNSEDALTKLASGFDVVLCDVNMPGMNGFELVQKLREDDEHHTLRIIMLTGISDQNARLQAVKIGADDFIGKPVDMTELQVRLEAQVQIKRQQDTIRRYQLELEEKVAARTQDLQEALDRMAEARQKAYDAYLGTIRRLALAAEFKDEITANHVDRVSQYAVLLAEGSGLSEEEVTVIRHATPMHDVGKLGIPDTILQKPGKLTEAEFAIIRTHTAIGERILGESESELIQAGRLIAATHHEKWDGSGYPNGLAGTDIPLPGRICAVADVFDALTSKRPYKEAFSNEQAFEILRRDSGTHFDPDLIAIFLDNIPRIEEIQARYPNRT